MIKKNYIYADKVAVKLILLFLFLFFSSDIYSQVTPETDILQQQQLEDAAQKSGEDADLSELEEQRAYYLSHKLDINNSSYEELMESDLMNDLQVQELLLHINLYGKLMTAEELQTINGFDLVTIRGLLPYIIVKSESDLMRRGFKEIWRNGKNQVVIRTQSVLEEQKGFSRKSEPSDTRYNGDPLKLYARYRFTFSNQISIGITGEKDAGEQFFKGEQKQGFDFYSAHFFLKDKSIKALAIGDYQLKYGQGLVLWSGLATGKSSDVINIKRNAPGIRPYTSVNEFSYLRGGAISYNINKITIDAFVSSKKADASTSIDSSADEILIGSFVEDGYHRTTSENNKKYSIKTKLAGGNINYRSGQLEAGVTGFYSVFNYPLEAKTDLYNQFDISGKEFNNVGVHYSYNFRSFLFFGETARSGNNAYATLNGIMAALDPKASFSLMYRNYSKDFELLYNNAFRESDNANERGLYMGVSLIPYKTFTWNSYIDYFTFPWLRYQVDAPSKGVEWLSQLSWAPDKKTIIYIRFKQQDKQENLNGNPIDALSTSRQRNLRLNASYKISPSFSMQSRVEFNYIKKETLPLDNGTVFFQDIKYNRLGSPVSIALRYATFDTDDYDTRIYAFENDIPGVFSIPSYYYKGKRAYIMFRYKLMRGIDVWARYGVTVYDNIDVIGSGLDEINGNHKSDLKLQLRLEF
jgi:hypothetical protein